MNRTIHKGRLAADPELKYVGAKGTAACNFTVVIPDKLAPKEKEKNLYLRFTAWGKLAEIISQHFVKGQEILVEGRISFSRWEKDGVKRMDLFVTVESFEFCGNKTQTETTKAKPEPEEEFDLPF